MVMALMELTAKSVTLLTVAKIVNLSHDELITRQST